MIKLSVSHRGKITKRGFGCVYSQVAIGLNQQAVALQHGRAGEAPIALMGKIAKRRRIGRATGTAVQRLAACKAVRNAA